MTSTWNRVKEANVLFSYVFTSNPLPGLNRILSTIAVCGIISFVLYAVLYDEKNEVTLLKENALQLVDDLRWLFFLQWS